MLKDAAYWIAIAHLPRWNNFKINSLITKIYIDKSQSLEDFFALNASEWNSEYELDLDDIETLLTAKNEIPNNSFLAESLFSQGYDLIPIISPDYSPTLKANLKLTYSPPLLYIKGEKQILKERSIAIVGSRDASDIALQFTDNIARLATEKYQVVVSGFAKGVDKAALDSALKYVGRSIIVLPQGILTFGTGFKTYYKQIINGDVLVLSTFFPKVPWRPELAMARNTIIYGLADEIYVAESSDKGGTWSGVSDGLRKGRLIYVRKPGETEKNANHLLIEKGAVPVDMLGNAASASESIPSNERSFEKNNDFQQRILDAISRKALTLKEICANTGCDWTPLKMKTYLETLDNVEIVKQGKSNKYRVKGNDDEQLTLFEE